MLDDVAFHAQLQLLDERRATAASILPDAASLCWVIGQKADARRYIYEKQGNDLIIRRSVEADSDTLCDLAFAISGEDFTELVNEEITLAGLIYANRVSLVGGEISRLGYWPTALRILYNAHPLWGQTQVDQIHDIDLQQRFTLDSPHESAKNFLNQTGYVIFNNVFSSEEIAHFNQLIDQQLATATPENPHSWWAENARHEQLCCRLTYLDQINADFKSLPVDARIQQIAACASQPLVSSESRMDGVYCVIKYPDIIRGVADLPWHKDCDLGGHPLLCPGLIIGVQLDHANRGNGQLVYLAGTHQSVNTSSDYERFPDTMAMIDTHPGDVTVHYAHTLHAAPPPTDANGRRRVLYFSYHTPEFNRALPQGSSYNDVLYTKNGSHIQTFKEQ